ncbi:MAG TPA: prepilin-type N-terminal cleavage/methylation domain-containing protein [Vicinamibacterales bacterium]|jgi:type II secretory pathway pseudopilin PulG
MVRRTAGFTLVELLLAATIMLLIMAGLFGVASASQRAFRTQPTELDMQQRLRTAAEVLIADLSQAGSGPVNGLFGAPLGHTVPSVLPYRVGSRGDPVGVDRSDAITVIAALPGAAAVPLRDPFASGSTSWARLDWVPACPAGDPACGVKAGSAVILVDGHGHADLFSVADVSSDRLQLAPRGAVSRAVFPAGSWVVPVGIDVYALRTGGAEEGRQLVHGDGEQPEMPQIDHVAWLSFEYFGEPQPPRMRVAPRAGEPVTTYGPAPPPFGVDDDQDAWQAGENCTFTAASGAIVPRLPLLGSGRPALVPLSSANLTDGPWCRDGSTANRYDADVLRIRRIRVCLRVEAASSSPRASGSLVPEQQVVFDVVPRTLATGR